MKRKLIITVAIIKTILTVTLFAAIKSTNRLEHRIANMQGAMVSVWRIARGK